MNKVVVGITGPIASGKYIVIKELEKLGFKTFSIGDRAREEADRRALPHERSVLQDMGNNLREKFGDAILIQLTEKLFHPNDTKITVDGIRNPGEIKYLKETYDSFIIGVDAPIDKRRILVEKRGGDAAPKTDQEFKKVEQRDRGIGEGSHGQQVDECLRFADLVVENKGNEEEFRRAVRQTCKLLKLKKNI